MHVTCPSCRTTYRVPAPYRRQRRPAFECAACGHVFEPGPSEPDWDDDEPFVMDDEDARARGRADDGRADALDLDDGDSSPDDALEPPEDGEPDEDDEETAEGDDGEEEEAPPPRRRRRERDRSKAGRARRSARAPRSSPARFAVRSLLAVVLFYGVVGVYVATFPEASRAAMERIPLVGRSLARTPLGLGQIELGDVSATFQPLAGSGDDGSALIVVATATNHAATTAEEVDVAIDLDGDPPRTERRACTGTVLNVSPFKRGELELMASYNGTRVAHIAPGASVTCQSIFLEYPTGIRSVRVRVVGAQGR